MSIYKLMDTGRLNPRPLGTERFDLVSCYPKSDMIGNSSGIVLTNLISLLCSDLLSVLSRTFSIFWTFFFFWFYLIQQGITPVLQVKNWCLNQA